MSLMRFGVVAISLTLANSIAIAEDRPKTAAEMGIMQGSPPKRIIDMSKWDKGPDNLWAFQHISEIIPTANISRGSGSASVLDRAPANLSELVFETSDGKEMTVNKMLEIVRVILNTALHEWEWIDRVPRVRLPHYKKAQKKQHST